MAPIPVLFTHYGEDWLRGSENVLLDLLRHLDRDRIAPVVWCNAAPLEEACLGLGIPTYRSPFEFYFDYSSPRFAPRRYAGLVREAVRLVRRHDIRVLHANSAAPTQWLAPAAAWTGRKLLTHLHIGYHRRSRYALLVHEADLVVGVAEALTRPLLQDGMDPARIATFYNGIDPTRLAPAPGSLRDRLGIPAGAVMVGSIGSLILRKGHDVLCRALAMPGLATVHAAIAGSGPDEAEIRAIARSCGVAERVHFLGHMGDPGTLYAGCDLFVLASRGEGLPLVLAEAGHCGLACIATRVGGIPEIVQEGETGLLVEPDDAPGLAAAIGRLAGDPALRHRFGEAARRRVADGFTVQSMARAFEAAYASLAAAPRASSLARSRLPPYRRLLAGRTA
jgi:glycosyltransferase involved in cell wall biosynthesis